MSQITVRKLPGEIARDMKRLIREAPDEIGEALWNEAAIIMNDSQNQCPVEFGKLRASGRVEDPVVRSGRVSVRLGYGKLERGSASRWGGVTKYPEWPDKPDYAVFVHENLEAYHTPPTKAKYLEDPVELRLSFDMIPRNIITRVNRVLGVA